MKTLVFVVALVAAALGNPEHPQDSGSMPCAGALHAKAMAAQERKTPEGEWCQRPDPQMARKAHACACHEHNCSDPDPDHVSAHTDAKCLNLLHGQPMQMRRARLPVKESRMEPTIQTPAVPIPTTQPTAIAISDRAFPVGQWLKTPYGQSDVLVKVITPVAAIVIRAAKTYVQSLIGFLAASGLGVAPSVLPSGDFAHLLAKCAGLAVAPTVISALMNVSVLLTALGDKYPTLKS